MSIHFQQLCFQLPSGVKSLVLAPRAGAKEVQRWDCWTWGNIRRCFLVFLVVIIFRHPQIDGTGNSKSLPKFDGDFLFHLFNLFLLVLSREWGNDPQITINNHPSNPQQPIHSLLNTCKLVCDVFVVHFYLVNVFACEIDAFTSS